MTPEEIDKRKQPKRFRLRPDERLNVLPVGGKYGVYFPATDLLIYDWGQRGTGRPREDLVEWIDEIEPEGEIKTVTFLEGGDVTWQSRHNSDERRARFDIGSSIKALVIDHGLLGLEIIDEGFSFLIDNSKVHLS